MLLKEKYYPFVKYIKHVWCLLRRCAVQYSCTVEAGLVFVMPSLIEIMTY